eukprot:1160098-Pelagomonas_calceolata.AAC.10
MALGNVTYSDVCRSLPMCAVLVQLLELFCGLRGVIGYSGLPVRSFLSSAISGGTRGVPILAVLSRTPTKIINTTHMYGIGQPQLCLPVRPAQLRWLRWKQSKEGSQLDHSDFVLSDADTTQPVSALVGLAAPYGSLKRPALLVEANATVMFLDHALYALGRAMRSPIQTRDSFRGAHQLQPSSSTGASGGTPACTLPASGGTATATTATATTTATSASTSCLGDPASTSLSNSPTYTSSGINSSPARSSTSLKPEGPSMHESHPSSRGVPDNSWNLTSQTSPNLPPPTTSSSSPSCHNSDLPSYESHVAPTLYSNGTTNSTRAPSNSPCSNGILVSDGASKVRGYDAGRTPFSLGNDNDSTPFPDGPAAAGAAASTGGPGAELDPLIDCLLSQEWMAWMPDEPGVDGVDA